MKKILLVLTITFGLLHGTQAGKMGMTLQQLRSHFGHEQGGNFDGSSADYTSAYGFGTIFFFDPDGTVGTINIWKEGRNDVQPFTEREIYFLLNKAAKVDWVQTGNSLKLECAVMGGSLDFTGYLHGKPVFTASIGWDARDHKTGGALWALGINTIR